MSAARDWRVVLQGRGLDTLLDDYYVKADAGRKSRLDVFFALCAASGDTFPHTIAHLALSGLDELKAGNRAQVLEAGRDCAFVLNGSPVPEPDIVLFDIAGAKILGDQTIVLDDRLYLTDQVRHMSGGWLSSGEGFDLKHVKGLDIATRTARVDMSSPRVSLPDNAVYFLFQTYVGSLSYGHFILDAMVQLIVFDHLRSITSDPVVPIVISSLEAPFKWPGMFWLFEHLVCPVSNMVVLRSEAQVDVRRAFTSNRLVHLGAEGVSTRAFAYLRQKIFDRIEPSEQVSNTKIYVTRKDAGYREAENIQEVEDLLAERGFLFVTVQDLSPQQTFDIFFNARIIVGMHGSGLMYNLFSCRQAKLIELSYPGFEWQILLACASACGHIAVRIPHNGLNIDVAALKDELAKPS